MASVNENRDQRDCVLASVLQCTFAELDSLALSNAEKAEYMKGVDHVCQMENAIVRVPLVWLPNGHDYLVVDRMVANKSLPYKVVTTKRVPMAIGRATCKLCGRVAD